MDSCEFRKQGVKVSPLWSTLLLLVFSIMLAACGDDTATSPSVATSNPATTTAVTTTAPATTQAAVPAAPGSNVNPTPTVVTTTSAATTAIYHPVINLSGADVTVGGSLTVNGEGFPANSKLAIQLGPEGGPIATDSHITSDASGKFSSKVFFVTYPDGSVVKPGKSALTVKTEDGLVKTSAVVPVVEAPATRYSPTRLIQDFFVAFKEEPASALAYLGSDLQTAIESGKASLPVMLGVQDAPFSVDVMVVEGKPNTYDVYENFQAGKQYIQMDLASDTNGTMKIVAIRIPAK